MIYQASMWEGNDKITGWKIEGYYGLFDSYTSALAFSMGLWEEYCEYHRTKGSAK